MKRPCCAFVSWNSSTSRALHLALPISPRGRVLLQQANGQRFQIVEIQRLALLFHRLVGLQGIVKEAADGGHGRRQRLVQLVQLLGQQRLLSEFVAQQRQRFLDFLQLFPATGPVLLTAAAQVDVVQFRQPACFLSRRLIVPYI